MKIYHGVRTERGDGVVTREDGTALPLALEIIRHSPDGFAWGYHGSGPAQLALAILVDIFGAAHAKLAVALHQAFKQDVIARLPLGEPFTLTQDQVDAWLATRLAFPRDSCYTPPVDVYQPVCPICGSTALQITSYRVDHVDSPFVVSVYDGRVSDFTLDARTGAISDPTIQCSQCGATLALVELRVGDVVLPK